MAHKNNTIPSKNRNSANARTLVYFFIPRHSTWNKKDDYYVREYESGNVIPFVKVGKTYRNLLNSETAEEAAQARGTSTGYPFKMYCVKVIDFGCYIKDGNGDIDDKIRNILYRICQLCFSDKEIGRSSEGRQYDDEKDINPGDEYFYDLTKEMIDEVETVVNLVINNERRVIKRQDSELRKQLEELQKLIDNNIGTDEDFENEVVNEGKRIKKFVKNACSIDNTLYKKYYDYLNTALFSYIIEKNNIYSPFTLINTIKNDNILKIMLESRHNNLSIEELIDFVNKNYNDIAKHIEKMKSEIDSEDFYIKYNIK